MDIFTLVFMPIVEYNCYNKNKTKTTFIFQDYNDHNIDSYQNVMEELHYENYVFLKKIIL